MLSDSFSTLPSRILSSCQGYIPLDMVALLHSGEVFPCQMLSLLSPMRHGDKQDSCVE